MELVPALAQAARTELAYLHTDVKRFEAIHLLRLPRWNATVDAILLEGKDFLRRIEQEQNDALALSAATSGKSRSQRFSNGNHPADLASSSSFVVGGLSPANSNKDLVTNGSPPKPFSRRSQQAAVRIVKVHNDERMERLFMMQEDAWAHTIELDRVDSTLIGDKYHFRLLHYAMVQISSAVLAQQQQQQQLNSSRMHGRSMNKGRGSAQSLRSLTLSQHTQEGQNASFVSNKSMSGGSTPVLPAIGTGGGTATNAAVTGTTSSSAAAALLTSTSAVTTSSANHNASFTFSDSLASARSDTSATSSTKPSGTTSSKKLQRQAVAAERAAQQQWQLIIKEGQEYHRNLIRKAVPCATTLGSLGFFLYYLHTVYSKEVEASAAKPTAV